MSGLTQKTYIPKQSDFSPNWVWVDAKNKTLGRLSTQISRTLRGKDKPIFSPHVDCGDFVIVTNASKIRLTGEKWSKKIYYRHSHHVGGLKSQTALELKQKHPERIILHAVRGMLPKNRLGRKLLTKLKVYPGEEHPHKAQNPKPLVEETEVKNNGTA